MSFRRTPQDKAWSRWLREHRSELSACGLPPEAYQTEMDWLLFLDHGYIESRDVHITQWWSIKYLNGAQANRLRSLLTREYGVEYPELVQRLESIVADGSA